MVLIVAARAEMPTMRHGVPLTGVNEAFLLPRLLKKTTRLSSAARVVYRHISHRTHLDKSLKSAPAKRVDALRTELSKHSTHFSCNEYIRVRRRSAHCYPKITSYIPRSQSSQWSSSSLAKITANKCPWRSRVERSPALAPHVRGRLHSWTRCRRIPGRINTQWKRCVRNWVLVTPQKTKSRRIKDPSWERARDGGNVSHRPTLTKLVGKNWRWHITHMHDKTQRSDCESTTQVSCHISFNVFCGSQIYLLKKFSCMSQKQTEHHEIDFHFLRKFISFTYTVTFNITLTWWINGSLLPIFYCKNSQTI